MFPYLIRLAIWLTLPITLLSLIVPVLGQMNPYRDWIVYLAEQPGPESATLHDLERHFNAPLPGIPYSYLMDFSTQGQLAFAAATDGQNEVRIFDVRSSVNNPQVIYTSPTSARFFRFNWSPDGHYLVFLGSEDNRNNYLYVWDGASVITINPPEPNASVENLIWSPDNRLAFTLRGADLYEGQPAPSEQYLWDGQQTVNLSQTPASHEEIGLWSRNGHLAYTSQGFSVGDPTTVMIWDGLNSTPAFFGFGELFSLGWNAEDELILSLAQSGDSSLPQLYRWDGEQTINISPDANRGYRFQTWSRDGRWAVSVMDLRGSVGSIQVRDADQQLLLDVPDSMYPVWTEAGSLLFCQQQPQGLVLQRWDGQRIRPVIQGSVIFALVPNGNTLYCNT